MNRAHTKTRGVFRFPDPTPQILTDGSLFQWYSNPEAEDELDALRRLSGHDPTPEEIVQANINRIDPAIIIILRSLLYPRNVATYHLIFPFLIGNRKEA